MRQVGPEAAHEYPKPSLGVRTQRFDLRQFSLGFAQPAPRRVEVPQFDQSPIVPGLGKRFLLLQDGHDLAGQRLLPAQTRNLQIGTDGLGQHPHARTEKVRLGGRQFSLGGSRIVSVAAPEIEFVGKLHAQGIGGESQPVGDLHACRAQGFRIQPDFLQLRSDTRVRRMVEFVHADRRLKQGKRRSPGDARPAPGLLYAGDRSGQVEIRREHLLDYPVEDRIFKGLPPRQGPVCTGIRYTGGKRAGRFRYRFEYRKVPVRRQGTGREEQDGGKYGAAYHVDSMIGTVIHCS